MTLPKVVNLELKPCSQMKRNTVLFIEFDSGFSCDLPAHYLRIHSPSAENKKRSSAPAPSGQVIVKIEAVGRYGLRLWFDDLHNTGIYSWAYLHELALKHVQV
jgi:DUF971 family protein